MDRESMLPTSADREQSYLLETGDGSLVSVPENRLAEWEQAQRTGGLSPSLKKQLRDRIVDAVYGPKR